MSAINNFWKKFLYKIFDETYSDFLTHEEINSRVDWYVNNLTKIKPEIFYKNVLFNMNSLHLSKLIISYKIKFLTEDYQELFKNPQIDEIDFNGKIDPTYKSIIEKAIMNFCIGLNHHSEVCINNGRNFLDLNISLSEVYHDFDLPIINYHQPYLITDGFNSHYVNFTQLIYIVAFNQNIFTGDHPSDEFVKNIKNIFPNNVDLMDSLKHTWSMGIPLKYVNCGKIFC